MELYINTIMWQGNSLKNRNIEKIALYYVPLKNVDIYRSTSFVADLMVECVFEHRESVRILQKLANMWSVWRGLNGRSEDDVTLKV